MQIASKLASFGECFARFGLDALFTFPDVEESWEGTVNVSVDFMPGFDMEDRVHPRDLPNNNPVCPLANLMCLAVRQVRHRGCALEAHWAHVVVVAMVDVGFGVTFQSLLQIGQGCLRVDVKCFAFAVKFERNTSLACRAEVLVEEREPEDESIVARERAERNTMVRWLEPEDFKCFFGGNRSVSACAQG